MNNEIKIDTYTMRDLNMWLDQNVQGDKVREAVKTAMVKLIASNEEYYGSQQFSLTFDQAKCSRIVEAIRQ